MSFENLYNVHEGLSGRTPGDYLDEFAIQRHQEKYGENTFPPGILVGEKELRDSFNPFLGTYNPHDGVTITVEPVAHRDLETGEIKAGPAPAETEPEVTEEDPFLNY